MKLTLSEIKNPALAKRIAEADAAQNPKRAPKVEIAEGKRVRQSSKPLLNKLETRFLSEIIETMYRHCWKFPQKIRFELGNGIRYKPDFVVVSKDMQMLCMEVKGPHAFRGGFENLKVAASLYPCFKWELYWIEDNHWKMQEIKP